MQAKWLVSIRISCRMATVIFCDVSKETVRGCEHTCCHNVLLVRGHLDACGGRGHLKVLQELDPLNSASKKGPE
jgi:hypothetical protein